MKIVIFWSQGMLWSSFAHMQALEQQGYDVIYANHETLDITNQQQLDIFFGSNHIDYIINCAAYTNVEKAEEDQLNYEINTLAMIHIAQLCTTYDIKCIHISTDYVFDGTQQQGYIPQDLPRPINAYGRAKRLGEQIALRSCPHIKIVRTSRLYGGWLTFKNFVNTMINLSQTKTELSVINDQRWAPTYTNDLVSAVKQLVSNRDSYPERIFHFCNNTEPGWITRYHFAQQIFDDAQTPIILHPITSDQYPTKAKRPAHSRMINNSPIQLPNRKDSLRQYITTTFLWLSNP